MNPAQDSHTGKFPKEVREVTLGEKNPGWSRGGRGASRGNVTRTWGGGKLRDGVPLAGDIEGWQYKAGRMAVEQARTTGPS